MFGGVCVRGCGCLAACVIVFVFVCLFVRYGLSMGVIGGSLV